MHFMSLMNVSKTLKKSQKKVLNLTAMHAKPVLSFVYFLLYPFVLSATETRKIRSPECCAKISKNLQTYPVSFPLLLESP